MLTVLLLVPLPARSQAPLDADRTLRTRHRWYAGVGGMAALASGTAADATLAVGRVMSERLLLGLEAGYAYRVDSDAAAGAVEETEVESFSACATAAWFPFPPRGAYLKAGIGYGNATEQWHAPHDWGTVVREESSSGVTAVAGVGWEFRGNDKLGFGVEIGALARPGLDEVDPRALVTLARYWGLR
jgi:opacity protein-like surface antigen